MSLIIWILVLGLLPTVVDCRFVIYHYNYTNNPKACDFSFKMDVGNRRGMNFSYEFNLMNRVDILTETCKLRSTLSLTSNIENFNSVQIEVFGRHNANIESYDRVLAKTIINLCSLADTLSMNIFLKQFFRPLLACAPFQMKCPFPKVRNKFL
jgi:hypothetical protein